MDLEKNLPITHKYGLHARATQRFVQLAKSFHSEVEVVKHDGEESDGKSVLGILSLGIEAGMTITLRVKGADAQKAMDALTELVEDDFGGI